jgi:hypothetical protein
MKPVEEAKSTLSRWSEAMYSKNFEELDKIEKMTVKNMAMFSLLETLKVIRYDLNGIDGAHHNVRSYYDAVFLEISKTRVHE